MDSPFVYNKPVTGRWFVGRKNELTILANLLRSGENVVMYEPPKTGKDSLLQQVFLNMKFSSPPFTIVSLSFMGERSLQGLCMRLGSELIKAHGSSVPDYENLVREHLGGTHFVFDEQVYQDTGSILSLNWDMDDNDIRAIVALPYKLGKSAGAKVIVCIDEFQDLLLCENGERLCAMMQEAFKARTQGDRLAACYVFCGSRVNAMKELFEHRRYFHRQVERLAISEIESKDIADSINRGFLNSGKVVDRNLLMGACQLFHNNVFYINWFASICDSLTKGYLMEPMLAEALSDMLAISEPRFRAMMADLTTFQVSLLRAVVEGNTRFSSAEVIRKYDLNSSANVRRLKDALCKKEILTFDAEENPHILDPLFEYWVTKYYFGIQ